VSAVELHWEQSGPPDAPAVLLGSSLGTTLEMWSPVLPGLADCRRIVRFDHRGHGRSPIAEGPYDMADLGGDVVALLDRLGLDRACYVGASLGGMIGLWLAAHASTRIEGLVCICSSAYLPPAEAWAARAASVRDAGSVAAVADAVLARWFTPGYAERHPDVITWMGAMLRDTSPEGYVACCGAIERMDLRDDLARITAPTLAIGAAEDQAISPEHSRAIAAGVSGARVEIMAHGAHLAAIERAQEVTALIERHLEGVHERSTA
jgi:3-oxoadipate enol-lactonase